MKVFKIILLEVILFSYVLSIQAQVFLTQNEDKKDNFTLVGRDEDACIYYDMNDFTVVKKAVELFKDDVQNL